jgi:hypothetical protein
LVKFIEELNIHKNKLLISQKASILVSTGTRKSIFFNSCKYK